MNCVVPKVISFLFIKQMFSEVLSSIVSSQEGAEAIPTVRNGNQRSYYDRRGLSISILHFAFTECEICVRLAK